MRYKWLAVALLSLIIRVEGQILPCWFEGLEVGADWLYWRTDQTGMEYGSTQYAPTGIVNATALGPQFTHQNGYRIYASYDFPCSWELYGSYNHVPIHAPRSTSVDPDPAVLVTNFINLNGDFHFLSGFSGIPFSSVDSLWKGRVNYCDLNLKKNFCVAERIVISPHFGGRGLWFDQTFDMDLFSPADGVVTIDGSFNEKLQAGGVKAGFSALWDIGWGLSLVGEFGGALLYSNLNTYGAFTVIMGGAPTVFSFHKQTHETLYMVDSFVGAQYTFCFSCREIEIHLGWENHLLFNTNELDINSFGNLTMEGLTLGGSIAF